jgi:hypothetical protein
MRYDDSQGPRDLRQSLAKFAYEVERAHQDDGPEVAAMMLRGFMVGYFSREGPLPSNLQEIQTKFEIMRIQFGGR